MRSVHCNFKWFGLLSSVAILLCVASSAGFAQTETVLYTFTGQPDGQGPSGLVMDAKGNLYGTTVSGGVFNYGTAFELPVGGGETILYSFTNHVDGASPNAPLLANGILYGTTTEGGDLDNPLCFQGCGIIYKITGVGKETILYEFEGPSDDGEGPNGPLIRDQAGNLYGTAQGGGWASGIVFELTATRHEHIYSFNPFLRPDGSRPTGSLVRDASGNLYGATALGGSNICYSNSTCGTVFKIDSKGESVLYSFGSSSTDGIGPNGGLILDSKGNFYGTTGYGGESGNGAVFKLNSSGHETVLYNFAGGLDGSTPNGNLLRDPQGNFYGTTAYGGTYGNGTVFKLTSSGQESVLYSFTGGADGSQPGGGLIADKQGNLYGIAGGGNTNCFLGCGVVFKLTP